MEELEEEGGEKELGGDSDKGERSRIVRYFSFINYFPYFFQILRSTLHIFFKFHEAPNLSWPTSCSCSLHRYRHCAPPPSSLSSSPSSSLSSYFVLLILFPELLSVLPSSISSSPSSSASSFLAVVAVDKYRL